MEKNRKRTLIILVVVLVAVLVTSIAFAAIQSELNIKGTANLNAETFNVKFLGPLGKDLSAGVTENVAPTIVNDYLIEDFDVTFTRSGDYAQYSFKVINNGDMDAKIGTLNIKTPECTAVDEENEDDVAYAATVVCPALTYTLEYADETPVAVGDILVAKDEVDMVLRLAYNSGSAPTPGNEVGAVDITNLDVTMIYVQN